MWSSDRQSSQSSRQSRRSFLYVGALGWALVVMVAGGRVRTAAAQRPGDRRPDQPARTSARVSTRVPAWGRQRTRR
jgi:hypothetical protein